MSERTNTTTLGILIFPGFPMACLTSCIEPLRAANENLGTGCLSLDRHRRERCPGDVLGRSGILTRPPHWLKSIRWITSFSPPAPTAPFDQPSKANAALQRLLRDKTRLGAISGGVFPLARTGLTGETPLSVHWCYEAAFQSEFPEVPIQGTVISTDGGFTTISRRFGCV